MDLGINPTMEVCRWHVDQRRRFVLNAEIGSERMRLNIAVNALNGSAWNVAPAGAAYPTTLYLL